MPPTIYTFIKTEEAKHSDQIQVGENWYFNFRAHVQLLFHLTNSQFYTGENNWLRPFKNVIEPILNLSFWTEDIEVKDIVFYIENKTGRILSFLIKKYHDEVYAKKHNIDDYLDGITETDLTYGGVLTQRTKDLAEIIDFTSIAFCDQTDILGGPLGFKMSFSPSKLRKMEKLGWGNKKNGATVSIQELIELAQQSKDPKGIQDGKKNIVTGKNIDVYIVKGDLPEAYLEDNNNMEDYYCQVQVVAFYNDKENKAQGVTLYRKEDDAENMVFFTSKRIPGRALGRGQGEMLLQSQVWTNFLTINKHNMLEAAAKVPLYTDDPNYQNRNKIQDMENLEITTIEDGKRIYQVPTAATANIQLYEKSINEWYSHAQLEGSAFDPVLGEQPVSGTTFRGQNQIVQQGRGLHDRRRGQRAKFIEERYRKWFIPDMVKEILDGKEFLATLSSEELLWVSDQLAENYANRKQIDAILDGEIPQDKEMLRQEFLKGFTKKGNKHLISILKDEFRDVEIKMGINVKNKQKNLAEMNDKILSIFQFAFANPQAFQQSMQIPALSQSFQSILEYSGLNPVDFNSLMTAPIQQPMAQPQETPELALNQPTNAQV